MSATHQSSYAVLSHPRAWKGPSSFISLIIINNKALSFDGFIVGDGTGL